MKKLFSIAAVVATIVLASCGSSKQSGIDYQQLSLLQQLQQMQQTQQNVNGVQRPTRTMREAEPCIELANEDCNKWRAYGTATSYIEKTALNEAARDARNQLAQMMKVAIEGAAQDYEQNATANIKNSAEAIGEAVMSQYVDEEIENTKTIKTTIYDRSDGSVQVYVCIEMRQDKDSFKKGVANTLAQDEIIGIKADREMFINKMETGLEDYKKRNRGE